MRAIGIVCVFRKRGPRYSRFGIGFGIDTVLTLEKLSERKLSKLKVSG
jgi:hypothetical protein